jgi:hypothetical protein
MPLQEKNCFSMAMIIFGGLPCGGRKYRYFLRFLWAAENIDTFGSFFRWAAEKPYFQWFFS